MLDFSHIQLRITQPINGASSERSSLIEPFVTRLNDSRKAGGYKPLGAAFFASKMSHIATDELHFHFKQCAGAKNFSSLWWYMNCPKKKVIQSIT